jgi:cold shock CspA family protein
MVRSGPFFGFIGRDDGRPDLYVHGSEIVSEYELEQHDRVTFIVARGRDGRPVAKQVMRVNEK